MSDATREQIGPGIVDFLERQDVRPEAIFSREDFQSDSIFGWLADQGRVGNMLGLSGVENQGFRNRLKQMFNGVTGEDNNAATLHVDGLGRVLNKDPNSPSWTSHDNIHIATTFQGKSTANFLSKMTGIPEDEFGSVANDISLHDLSTYVLFHEVGHTADSQVGMVRSQMELNADLFANDLYAQAYSEGLVKNPNVPQVFTYARALEHMTKDVSKDYAYNGTIDAHENISGAVGADRSGAFMLYQAKNELHLAIAKPFESARTHFEALSSFTEDGFLSDAQKDRYYELEALGEDASLADIEAFMADVTIPEEFKEDYEYDVQSALSYEGSDLAQDQPGLLYQAAVDKLVAGDYDGDPILKQQMENFVIGAERLAPSHFDIEGTPYLDYLQSQGIDKPLGIQTHQTHATPVHTYGHN